MSCQESISSTFYVWLFQRFFDTANCDLQMATSKLSATCKWHNHHKFYMNEHGEICFQKQAAFLSFWQKAVCKHVDEIDAWLSKKSFTKSIN